MPSNQIGVFISYSRQDRFIAETLAQRLPKVGYQPWVDFEGMVGGDEWKRSIENALSKSAAVLVLLTPESMASKWVNYEVSRARDKNRPLIPLMFRTCEVPQDLDMLHFVDFRQSADRAFEDLQRALLLAVVRSSTDEHPTEPRPPELAIHLGLESTRETITSEVPSVDEDDTVDTLPPVSPEETKPLALVIEDQTSSQNLLRDVLSDMGLNVQIAGTRNEATQLIQSGQHFDFVTLDMQLGPDDDWGQEGMYLLDLLKRYQTDAPIVMITHLPYDKIHVAQFFVQGRIKHMLDKPIDQEKLRALVWEHVPGLRQSR